MKDIPSIHLDNTYLLTSDSFSHFSLAALLALADAAFAALVSVFLTQVSPRAFLASSAAFVSSAILVRLLPSTSCILAWHIPQRGTVFVPPNDAGTI